MRADSGFPCLLRETLSKNAVLSGLTYSYCNSVSQREEWRRACVLISVLIGAGLCIRRREAGGTDFAFYRAREFVLRDLEIVRGLKIEPKAWGGIEVASQAQ